MLTLTTNNQRVPKSVFCTLVNRHCVRHHGRNYNHELVLINVDKTSFSRPRSSRASLEVPQDQDQDMRTSALLIRLPSGSVFTVCQHDAATQACLSGSSPLRPSAAAARGSADTPKKKSSDQCRVL